MSSIPISTASCLCVLGKVTLLVYACFLIYKMVITRPTLLHDNNTCLLPGLVHISPSSSHMPSCHRAFPQAISSSPNPFFLGFAKGTNLLLLFSSQLKCYLLQEGFPDFLEMSDTTTEDSRAWLTTVYIFQNH